MTWTEILHIAGPALSFAAVVVGFVTWLFMRHIRGLERQRRFAENQRDNLQSKFNRAQASLEKLAQYRAAYRDLKERNEELTEIEETFDAIKAKLQARVQAAQAESAKLRAEVQKWQRSKLQADKERQALKDSTSADAGRIQQLKQDLDECLRKIEELESEGDRFREQIQGLEAGIQDKQTALDEVKKERFDLREQLTLLEDQLEGAQEQSGRVWEKPLGADAPAFVPLAARKTPIISVINLKGGVGKTTLTANLAAMLGLHDKRVLLIDLDYQRSLSLMCCSHEDIKHLHLGGHCLQHFLLDKSPDGTRLNSCLFSVKTADGCKIVATSEAREGTDAAATLEDAEMRLMARWLLGQGTDVRMHLRRALHSPWIQGHFDYVLLDCPPRFSTACVNALAASDFALVPVLLDRTSAVSAPNLLRKLKRFRDCGVMPSLEVLGIVANDVRFLRGELIKSQAQTWDDLVVPCEEAWGRKVHFFKAKIKHSSDVAAAADRHEHQKDTGTFAAFHDDLKPLFTDLMKEMEGRVANERRNLAAVPA
jgi:cellulose biosynthesis protein BcsQ